jgi:hypothetical protein
VVIDFPSAFVNIGAIQALDGTSVLGTTPAHPRPFFLPLTAAQYNAYNRITGISTRTER